MLILTALKSADFFKGSEFMPDVGGDSSTDEKLLISNNSRVVFKFFGVAVSRNSFC